MTLGPLLYAVFLGLAAILLIPTLVGKIFSAFDGYKDYLAGQMRLAEAGHRELVEQEGLIYDSQLKSSGKLAQISGLYEITKEMSTSLHYGDVFRILVVYLEKAFLFKRVRLIVPADADEGAAPGGVVLEAEGFTDGALKARGIFPTIKVESHPLDEHDRKVYGLLASDVRRLEIARSGWGENPYIDYLPKGSYTYMAVPMVIENRLAGILAIEDLPASDFEKFTILAAQFTLEMRRIILYERVENMAITDGLTKAFAKRHILERLAEEFERSVRHNFNLAFVMADIDYFKKYNDTYGHLVGDVVLKEIVAILKAHTREVDLVGRFGGEEFCVILHETKKDEAAKVSERIRDIIEKHKFRAYDESTRVTVSIGVAAYPEDCKTADELVENSDKALYTAKTTGRNRVCVFKR
jgi:diguanylate cyclase (GGDEF)-like protein